MGKDKKPRKPKAATPDQSPTSNEELERQTQASELVPPEPVRLPEPRIATPRRPVLFELLQTIRTAVGAMLDIADAAADAIMKRLEGRG